MTKSGNCCIPVWLTLIYFLYSQALEGASANDVIYLEPGVYPYQIPQLITKNITIEGEGATANDTLIVTTAPPDSILQFGNATSGSSLISIIVNNLGVRCLAASETNYCAIRAQNIVSLTLSSVEISTAATNKLAPTIASNMARFFMNESKLAVRPKSPIVGSRLYVTFVSHSGWNRSNQYQIDRRIPLIALRDSG